jgi:hypothetical protein
MMPARRATTSMEGPIVLLQRENTKPGYGVDRLVRRFSD